MSTSPPNILYIDDDEGLRRLVAKALTRRGFVVSAAANGADGVAMAREQSFDLIAVDHYMPGQDGLATLAALKALDRCPPVIYVTGSDETRVAVAALKAGAADYIIKAVGEDFFDLLASTFAQTLYQVRLQGEKEAAEEELRAMNSRLQALLKEVNHRVANSLQLVSAFVHMQTNVLDDQAGRLALLETQQRIQAIAQVHRHLYASDDVDYVFVDDYLHALCSELEQTWSAAAAPRRIHVAIDRIRLKSDQAVSLGVIVNELVSNACKYAYPHGCEGEVRIFLRREEAGQFMLVVEDDGEGLPADGSIKGTGLGTKLVNAMAASLNGALSYDRTSSGVRARVTAPIE